MVYRLRLSGVLIALFLATLPLCLAQGSAVGAYKTGQYRDLPAEAGQKAADGKPLSDLHSTGMVATTAVGSLAATDGPVARAFVEQLWATPIPSGEQRYYDGTLYMMSLLHLSGQFRIWGPRLRKAPAIFQTAK